LNAQAGEYSIEMQLTENAGDLYLAEDLQEKWAGEKDATHHNQHCKRFVSTNRSLGDLVYPDDPDGLVLCRECRSPLRALEFPELYCDLGGQG
jgi:hypothetical protein